MSVRWDGAGIPQVGELVELMDDSQSQTWGDVTIKFYGESFAVWDDHGEECSNSLCNVKVRPIRTEAERKRESAIDDLVETMIYFYGNPKGAESYKSLAERIFDAVAIGKIPGVRLADD